jgi:hypothetical protein
MFPAVSTATPCALSMVVLAPARVAVGATFPVAAELNFDRSRRYVRSAGDIEISGGVSRHLRGVVRDLRQRSNDGLAGSEGAAGVWGKDGHTCVDVTSRARTHSDPGHGIEILRAVDGYRRDGVGGESLQAGGDRLRGGLCPGCSRCIDQNLWADLWAWRDVTAEFLSTYIQTSQGVHGQ